MSIEIDNLCVRVKDKTILSGISVSAPPGRLTAIIGPNGSGKTTLVKALSGDLAFSGEARLNGVALSAMTPRQTALWRAVLPQFTALSFPCTVREIVRLGLMNGCSGVGDGERDTLPDRALARVDLAGFAGRFYQELSGGEQQRVQLARVLCQVWRPVLRGRPRYMILDEPVSNLDIKHQLIIMGIAAEFAAEGGGVIAILHDLNLTARFADRVAMLRHGQLMAYGTPGDVLTSDLMSRAFECRIEVGALPRDATPFILAQTAEL